MSNKRILVVDDDPDLLFLVAHGVKSLSANYNVSTAPSAISALEQIKNQQFDLVITDYMMPEMTGLELVPRIQKLSPETLFIMMTAHHDTNRIRNSIEGLNISGFVGKPFMLPELLDTIKEVIQQTETRSSTSPRKTGSKVLKKEMVTRVMRGLHRQVNAMTILLANADGQPVYIVGQTDSAKAGRLAAFVASNFLAITELSVLFDDSDSVFKSSYYEGNNYNIYAYNIDGSFFLAVVVRAQVKPGTVWFYTKQAASVLEKIFPSTGITLTAEANANLAQDFDNLLGDETDRKTSNS